MRGADLLVQTLAAAGVTRIFSLSGNQIMPVYDACLDAGIKITHVRHEAAAVFMADAWAQLTGKIGVALVTAAPGFANAVGALYTAMGSESPVLLLSGDSPVAQDGIGAFQELDQLAVSRALTKRGFRPISAHVIGEEAALAIKVAISGRPGPVHMALPFDVLNTDTAEPLPVPEAYARTRHPLCGKSAAKIATAIADADLPVIITGPALNRTRTGDLIADLQSLTGAPVLSLESPRGLGDPSLGDLKGAFAKADLIVSLGKAIDFTIGFGGTAFEPTAKWMVVDADADALDRARKNLGDKLQYAIIADPDDAAETIANQTGHGDHTNWRKTVAGHVQHRASAKPASGITAEDVAASVQNHMDANTVAIIDGGECGQWAQAGINAPARLINGPAGAIGGCLCYAVAAKQARPDAQVIAVMGDGTAGFHFAEFETAVRENAPFVVVIANDGRWNAEHEIQLRDYGPNRMIGCELSDARYDQAVAGLGGHGEYVTDKADLDAAITRALASGKTACVNVQIEGQPAPNAGSH